MRRQASEDESGGRRSSARKGKRCVTPRRHPTHCRRSSPAWQPPDRTTGSKSYPVLPMGTQPTTSCASVQIPMGPKAGSRPAGQEGQGRHLRGRCSLRHGDAGSPRLNHGRPPAGSGARRHHVGGAPVSASRLATRQICQGCSRRVHGAQLRRLGSADLRRHRRCAQLRQG